jgi:replicative DNA helicase
MSAVMEGNGFGSGVKTGFYELDEPLNGLSPSDYVILGAQPSVGKSAFALHVAHNAAQQGNRVFYFSPEMTKEQLGLRLLSMESGVPYSSITRPETLTDEQRKKLFDANKKIVTLPIEIDDSPSQGIINVRLRSRLELTTNGLDLIIVDYLQLLCPDDDDKSAVTVVSKRLKGIAQDLNVPVLACSQLRRPYGQEPRRPDKHRLKGSGQLEADADAVLLMWHPKKDDLSKVEVFIDKHRNGPLGQTTLKFEKETTKFTSGGW